MKTPADPVRDYLSAAERETSALPADRRQELLADLAEHIEATRAVHPDAGPGEVLARLGDPLWTPVQKTVGVLLTLVLPTTANIIREVTTIAPAGDEPALVANLVTLALLAATSTWLWRSRRA
ncbi:MULTISPECIES: HAAS signaling domain-containing protein [Streptomyces]|uniref:HAAS signaling domain-containing protein n=1 Tax=Streptomyces TaxID=1883 RepID=UPI00278C83A8|nr:hypothetical protein [Streptomyces hydrogenans]